MTISKSINKIHGLSLVELMVSIAISLILLLGIANIYLGSKETYRVREDFGILQELGRQVLETVTKSIQMADHWGGVAATDVTIGAVGTLVGSGSCDATWMQNVSQSLVGADGAGTKTSLALIGSCIDGYVANSDILIVRYADGRPIPDSIVNASSELYIRSEVENTAQLFLGSTGTSGTSIASSDAAKNYRYRIEAYFLRSCSTTYPACTDNNPSLARIITDGVTFDIEVLADGVEQMQFQYGVDTNGDTVADQFLNAGNVTNWAQVVAVNVDMLVRTPSPDHSVTDTTTYNLAGGASFGGFDFTPSTAEQPYHRKQLTKLIQVRNRVRA